MLFTPGTTLGSYSITAKIGEGGMGEVYRATDTKLDRDVALKVLPQAFTDDSDRLARFEREAKVLASLNHPNIGHIYGLEEAEGQKALVLELVEGPTLADRIAQGPIPINEALLIAKQLAEALEAAHEAGVIHRDLKPANIKVKEDGTVKVLDFGLAKALDSGSRSSFTDEASVTSTAFGTEVGVILGTPTYMSPEQASGLATDERSDVWSFGAVLFEMLTGRPPFNGSTTSHVVASILKTEPDWGLLPPAIHPAIRRLLRRCLVKELKGRIPHVGMARIEISDCLNLPGSATDELAPGPRGPLWRQPVVMALIAALAAAMVALIALGLATTEAPPLSVGRFRIPEDARSGLTLSPDGGRLVYSSASQGVPRLVIRSRDQLEVVPIPGTEGGYAPFFSPDGASLGFFAEGELKRVDLDGGPPVTLAQAGSPGASWGSNGAVVFGIPSDGLMLVPANGGEPRALTAVAERERHLWPEFLPGEEAVLFTRWTVGDPPLMEIVVVSLETNEQRTLIAGTGPRFVSTGHLVFARDSSLWAVPFDEERLEVTGEPAPVVEGVQVNAPGGWSHYAVAADGTLAYLPTAGDEVELSLVIVDRDGREETLDGIGPGDYRDVGWSPEGGRLVLTVDRTNLWTYDLARGVLAPLTTDADAVDEYPVWTPDSQRVVFASTREGVSQLLWRAADGTGTAEPLLTAERGTTPLPGGWLPDGTTMLFSEGTDLFTLRPTDETPPHLLFDAEFFVGAPAVSPDGAWMAYHAALSGAPGRPDVYVERYPGLGDRQRISTSGGRLPRWSADGTQLFYLGLEGRQMFMVPMTLGASLAAGVPTVLFEGTYLPPLARGRQYDVSPDGERFVMVRQTVTTPDTPRSLVLVLNWFEELNERVPTP